MRQLSPYDEARIDKVCVGRCFYGFEDLETADDNGPAEEGCGWMPNHAIEAVKMQLKFKQQRVQATKAKKRKQTQVGCFAFTQKRICLRMPSQLTFLAH